MIRGPGIGNHLRIVLVWSYALAQGKSSDGFAGRSDMVLQFSRGKSILLLGASLALASGTSLFGQAVTIDTSKLGPAIDRKYAQIEPTKVDLPTAPIDARGHQDLLRALEAEQGFAMRPLPRGKKGLTLAVNGNLSPVGEAYMTSVLENGVSVKPGDRLILSNIRIDKEKIVFDVNGGPDHKHEFLRHVSIGVGNPQPVVQDNGQEPMGARITLAFGKPVPEVTPAQVKSLLAPLISFDMKTPVQAYTDTLPPKLKQAILDHKVMVGMNTDMVIYTLGQPETKSRELDGLTPFEEWIYGHPPQDVTFVRINGNRVIRVEVAKLGQALEVFTTDEVSGMMTTDGKPVIAEAKPKPRPHTIQLGDADPDLDTHASAPTPTLKAPGEKLPGQDPDAPTLEGRDNQMKPVIFPKDTTDAPARTVQAHPKPAAPPDDDDAVPAKPAAKPGETPAAPASATPAAPAPSAPAAAPGSPTPSNFYSDSAVPAKF
jgi:hypothetical protein